MWALEKKFNFENIIFERSPKRLSCNVYKTLDEQPIKMFQKKKMFHEQCFSANVIKNQITFSKRSINVRRTLSERSLLAGKVFSLVAM